MIHGTAWDDDDCGCSDDEATLRRGEMQMQMQDNATCSKTPWRPILKRLLFLDSGGGGGATEANPARRPRESESERERTPATMMS